MAVLIDPPMLIDTCVTLIDLVDNVDDIKIYGSCQFNFSSCCQ